MSTNAFIIIQDENRKRQFAIEKHWDGNIHRGLGALLFKFLETRSNGAVEVNGTGDLTAQLITYLKGTSSKFGDVYVIPSDVEVDAQYTYIITPIESLGVCKLCGQRIGNVDWEILVLKNGAYIFKGSGIEAIQHFGRNPMKPLF